MTINIVTASKDAVLPWENLSFVKSVF